MDVSLFFAVTVKDLKLWRKSAKTHFGRRSGDGTRELTDQDKFILEKLQFLGHHTAHVSSRHTCSVSIKFNFIILATFEKHLHLTSK